MDTQVNFVAYYRVSTQQQGRSGLGLDAQRRAVEAYLAGSGGKLVSEHVEVETGKGTDALARRPKLSQAMTECKQRQAVLIIAKLDRLARNVHFISGLLESGCDFVAADMPQANKTMLHIYAAMSEWERDQISARTKQALAAAKDRGVRLGNPRNLQIYQQKRLQQAQEFAERLTPLLQSFRSAGLSQRDVVRQLNQLGVRTSRGGQWSLIQLQRVIQRIEAS